MDTSPPDPISSPSNRRGLRPARARRPLHARKSLQRQEARRRIIARTRSPLTAQQRAFDPLGRPDSSRGRRRLHYVLAVLGSLALHVAAVGGGLGWHTKKRAADREQVKIEVRQRPPEPPPEKKPEPPAPVEKPTRPPPKVAKVAPPPAPEITKTPPPRIVGLSFESTTEGGNGPAFAVGNTRAGETEKTAVEPKAVKPLAAPAPVGPARSNQAASHIPMAGVSRELPQFKGGQKKPEFPPTLRSQGIEGDVPVMVTIDVTGKVTSVKIMKPSPYPEFDEAARKTALTQEFEPAKFNGVATAYTLSFTYHFRLEDE